jgi:II/X family phage/plasmid replication protein
MTDLGAFFLDKMNVVQEHYTNELRLVGTDLIIRIDLQTGDERSAPDKLQLEGSHSSSLMIRSNGSRVEVYGNPSRWNRMDNLFGLTTIDECMQVYNHILRSLDLPEFTKCTKYMPLQQSENEDPVYTSDGALIKHLDFTRNMAVGEGNEMTFTRGLASHSIGRSIKPYLYPDGNTVDWFGKNLTQNGSTHRYVKVYNKAVDLKRHQRRAFKNATEIDKKYYEKIQKYCTENGVVREEHSFKNRFLKENMLFGYGLVKESYFTQYLTCIDEIRKRFGGVRMEQESIADHLLEDQVVKSRQAANATQMFYLMWLTGQQLDRSKSQYYVHKQRLLEIGIDISIPLDVTRAPLRIKEAVEIEVKPLAVPDWYRKPKTSHLKQVA